MTVYEIFNNLIYQSLTKKMSAYGMKKSKRRKNE